jgi:EpsI family protein
MAAGMPPPPTPRPTATPTPTGSATPRPTAAAVALACALLVGSGALRLWQARRVEALLAGGLASPVPLERVPLELGPWRGQPEALDPQIARRTGQTDHVFRTYVDTRTGVALDVIILYGPAVELKEHAPEQCYPAAGFAIVEGPSPRAVPTPRGEVPFHALVVAKGEGGAAQRQEIYYTWRYGGRWTPARGPQKLFERIPAMYKVHLARRLAAAERPEIGNPCQDFLAALMPALDDLLGGGPGG